jgi:hypothetical protein
MVRGLLFSKVRFAVGNVVSRDVIVVGCGDAIAESPRFNSPCRYLTSGTMAPGLGEYGITTVSPGLAPTWSGLEVRWFIASFISASVNLRLALIT